MKVIGLTGGIGSGKSTVAGFLAEMGAKIIDADTVGHRVLESDEQVKQELVEAFGSGVLTPEGKIDRQALAGIAFRQPKALPLLNKITHPRITEEIKKQLEEYREKGISVVVIEAPLLIEVGWAAKVDRVWVTTAPQDVIVKRLEGKGMTPEEAMARIKSQITDQERIKKADVVIDTDTSLEELKELVRVIWEEIKPPRGWEEREDSDGDYS
jgi:dephospho-CoA kinase